MEQSRKTLLDIIAWDAEVRFVVPKYQRHYIWSDKEIARMWDDWRDVCDRPLKHFCGVMLFRKLADEGPLSWEIVDGQQRMTTFFIFFIALRDFCVANDIDFSQLSHVFTTENADECRLQLLVGTSDDRYVLNALLKRQPDAVEQGIKDKSHVWQAYSFFTTRIQALSDTEGRERIPPFTLNVLENLDLVVLTCDPEDDVRRIFESLNSRGKHIDPEELVANLITYIGSHNEALNERAEDTWKFVTKLVDQDDLGTFLDTFGRRNGKQSERGGTFDEIKFEVDEAQRSGQVREWLIEFERAARNYHDILFPENSHDPIQVLLGEFQRLRVPKLNPFLLALLETFRETPASAPLIHNVVSLAVRLLICLDRPSYRFEQFAAKAGEAFFEINQTSAVRLEKVIALIDDAWIDDETFQHRFCMKSIYGPGAHLSRLRYYLEKLEERLESETGAPFEVDFGPKTTIEHIMPQTLDADGAWERALRANDPLRLEAQHQAMVHTIGNLTVLLTTDNPVAGNKPYRQKRDFYLHPNQTLEQMGVRRRAKIGNCALNRYFENVSTWNFQAIADRSKFLAHHAVQIWNKESWNRETQ